jgi:peptidoglycan/xylan/chitin deacetylase (PgdA/CDA1 family)
MVRTLVLCYHAIGDTWPASVPGTRLHEQVELLLRRGYEGVTFTEAATSPPERKRFALTFDDAYVSVLERAFPVLDGLGVPGTVFVVTAFAEEGLRLDWPGMEEWGAGADPDELRSLSWSQLEQLVQSGWEVGSHTHTHPYLTQLADDALARELRESRETCERALGRPCRSIAYPYGDVDDRVAAAAAAAGYEAGCSLSVATSGPLLWPRVGVYAIDSSARFRLKISPVTLGVRRALAPLEARVR